MTTDGMSSFVVAAGCPCDSDDVLGNGATPVLILHISNIISEGPFMQVLGVFEDRIGTCFGLILI